MLFWWIHVQNNYGCNKNETRRWHERCNISAVLLRLWARALLSERRRLLQCIRRPRLKWKHLVCDKTLHAVILKCEQKTSGTRFSFLETLIKRISPPQAHCFRAEVFLAGATVRQHRRPGAAQSIYLVSSSAGGWWEFSGARASDPHRAPGRSGWAGFPHGLCPHRPAGRQWRQG